MSETTGFRIGFAGATHLGLVSAAAAAGRGLTVVAFDPDPARIAAIAAGALPVDEPGLAALIAESGPRLRFTADPAELASCAVVVVAADVPTNTQGTSDLAAIRRLSAIVAGQLGQEAVLVVLSQVPPGFTRSLEPVPLARRFYQVETLVFGRAVERALSPERVIIGAAEPEQPLPPAYLALLEAFDCPRLVMGYESAELAKIAINCCLVASIGVANTLAELCERVGADWSDIVPALRLDRRIGPHAYLTPGLGIAGGNLERDLATVLALAHDHETEAGIVAAWLANSAHRRDWAFRTLDQVLLAARPTARVAVLGLAYKENTDSLRNSPALALIARMPRANLVAYDPVVAATAVPGLPRADSALAAVEGADAVAIMTPWPAFRTLQPAALAAVMAGRLVLDPYRVLDRAAVEAAGLAYHTLGRSPPRLPPA